MNDMKRYSCFFGCFPSKEIIEEWSKLETDDINEAVAFCKHYPDATNVEHDGYIYVLDNTNYEIVDGTFTVCLKEAT